MGSELTNASKIPEYEVEPGVNVPRYAIEAGLYGKRFVLMSHWSDSFYDVILREDVVELELNHGKFWPGDRIDFVSELTHLQALILVHLHFRDTGPVQRLHELRYVQIGTYESDPIDFSNFPRLEQCLIEWSPALSSAIKVKSLRRFAVNRLPADMVVPLGDLTGLRDLSILSCSATSLDALRSLTLLQSLRLARFRQLESNAFLQSLRHLKHLWIQACSGFHSLEPLRSLLALECIWLEDLGQVESMLPLSGLVNLRDLAIGGKTVLLDDSASCISDLPKLERLVLKRRRRRR